MKIRLNRDSVPENLRERVQEIAIQRFPGSSVTWHEEGQGFIVLEIPESDYGSMQDIDSNGLPVGEPESGHIAVISALEEKLQSFVRSQVSDP